MKKALLFLTSVGLGFSLSLSPTKVQASSTDYEELTYDDLVSQLSEKKDIATQKKSRAQVNNHVGLGIVNTWTQVVSDGKTYRPNMNGFELSTGVDLNSDRVRGEFAFRNFFEKSNGDQTGSLRELSAGLQFRRELNSVWRSKFGGGFSIRMLSFSAAADNVSEEVMSSMLMAGAGIEARMSSTVALGADLSTHFPFGTTTADRNSIDLGLKLDTTF
jgi:hypothetical protein